MAFLVESVKYGSINTTDTTTHGFYVIMFKSEAYTLQDNTTVDGQIITSGKLVVKAQYISSVQVNTYWYWYPHLQYYVITVITRTILHPPLEVNAVTYFHDIPKIVCNRTQAKRAISIHPMCLTDSDYNYIIETIGLREKFSLKEMWKFIVITREIHMSISNEYFLYFFYIYILTVIGYFYLFVLLCRFDIF